MAPLLPAPTYLIGITQTVAAAPELGGCGIDGGEGHWLLGQEGGRRLDQGWRVSKGRAQAPLLAQDLLVGHGVDGVGEGEGWAAEKGRQGEGGGLGWGGEHGSVRLTCPGQTGPCPEIRMVKLLTSPHHYDCTSLKHQLRLPTACCLRRPPLC